MNYSKPSISIAMKKLKSEGMVEMDLNGYITLTPLGEKIAQRTYRRHQLLEKVLVAMGVDEETAAEEACRIEHVIDENTYEKINEFYEKHMSGANQ